MIVVFGGTGRVGSQVVERLRGNRHRVRVVTRARPTARSGSLEIVVADLHDRVSLMRAVRGARAVVCTVQGGGGKGMAGPRGIEGDGVPRLIDVAQHAGVEHFVYFSTASARPDSPVEFFRRKFETEEMLRSSGVPFSILRPTHLVDTWAEMLARSMTEKQRAMVLGTGKNPVSWVSAADVARVAADLATAPGTGWCHEVGGPEALTLRELNGLIAASLGVRLEGERQISLGMLRVVSKLVQPFNPVVARQMQMGIALDSQPQVVDSTMIWAEHGEPVSMSSWLERNRAKLAAGAV